MKNAWGEELIIDCAFCNSSILEARHINNFVRELVPAIGMKAYGAPLIVHFAQHDEDKSGYSLCQMIETSAITGHFVDKTRECYLNIFSCLEIDEEKAIAVLRRHFEPRAWFHTKLIRGPR